jgi:hypothetical protein
MHGDAQQQHAAAAAAAAAEAATKATATVEEVVKQQPGQNPASLSLWMCLCVHQTADVVQQCWGSSWLCYVGCAFEGILAGQMVLALKCWLLLPLIRDLVAASHLE